MISPAPLGKKIRQSLREQNPADLKNDKDRIKYFLNFGILAPSTHNTQPWKIIIKQNVAELFADFSKKIPEADPSGRDMHMSLGAFITNTEMAAAAYGVTVATETVPDNESGLAARLNFEGLADLSRVKDPSMLDAILRRQNFRGFFEKEIDQRIVSKLISENIGANIYAPFFFDEKTKTKLANLTVVGLKEGYSQPAFRREISNYINHNLSRKRSGLHGYSLRLNLPLSFVIPKVMKHKDIGEKLGELNYKSFMSAPGVVVILSKDDEAGWIEAGRKMELIMLKLVQKDIRSSIYAAAVEMGDLRQQLVKIINPPTGTLPQLLFCIGKSSQNLPYSARQELDEVVSG